jgi:hypothetical protein
VKLRLFGFVATVIAVVVLVGSLVAGLGGAAGDDAWLAPAARPVPGEGERIRVEVLNSAGIVGLARDVTEQLRSAGYDVVYYGNAGRLARDSSVVLDRAGNAPAVARVAESLGIPRVEVALDTTLYLEATVILAPDWPSLPR